MKRGLSETCYMFFSTLSNPTRLGILELLNNGPKNVTEISEALNQNQSMISHNLKPLERCSIQSTTKLTATVSPAIAIAGNKGVMSL